MAKTVHAKTSNREVQAQELEWVRETLHDLADTIVPWHWRTMVDKWLFLTTAADRVSSRVVQELIEDLLKDRCLRRCIGAVVQMRKIAAPEYPPNGLLFLLSSAQEVVASRIDLLDDAIDTELEHYANICRCKSQLLANFAHLVRMAPPMSCPFVSASAATWMQSKLLDYAETPREAPCPRTMQGRIRRALGTHPALPL